MDGLALIQKRSGGRKTKMEGRGESEKENGIEGF